MKKAVVCQQINHKKKRRFLKDLYNYRFLLLMLLPTVVFFIVFCYVPMYGLVLAFKKFDYSLGILGSPWNGLDNFQYLFRSGKLSMLIFHTVAYNVLFIAVGLVFQVTVSIFLSQMTGKWFKKACQATIFLPYFISWVSVGAIVYNLLSYRYGAVNALMSLFGMDKINFYSSGKYWPMILTVTNTWKGLGYGTVIYLAAIAGIDAEIYEAAQIDGAGPAQQIFHVTIPNLVPTMVIVLLLNLGSVFRGNFQMFWNLVGSNNLLQKTTDVIDTYVYRSMLSGTNFGMTTAAGLIQSVLCFVFILCFNAGVRKISPDNALF